MARNIPLLVLGILFFAGVAFSAEMGCAEKAYAAACSNCQFDANGQMDQSCYLGYQASGTSCVSRTYPTMSDRYVAGQCPAVDRCAEELSSCKAQYSSGNDKGDCEGASVQVCFAAADACIQDAAISCGEAEQQCAGSSAAIVLLLAGLGFVKLTGKGN